MNAALSQLPHAAAILVRHVGAYLELLVEDGRLEAQLMSRRLLSLAVAILAAQTVLMLGSAWIVGSVWNSQARVPTLVGLMLLFVLIAAMGLVAARRRRTGVAGLREDLQFEWAEDQKLIRELSGRAEAPTDRPETPPLMRLRQTRLELRNLLTGGGGPARDRFPRSKTMRLLKLVPVISLARLLLKR